MAFQVVYGVIRTNGTFFGSGCSGTTSDGKTYEVSFDKPFSEQPSVTLTAGQSPVWLHAIDPATNSSSAGTEGFTAVVQNAPNGYHFQVMGVTAD